MARIQTNKLQYKTLVELIKERKDIATGIFVYGSDDVKKFWEHTANELNKLGQAQRDPTGWRKVWLDYKCYIKKKLLQYNNDVLERYTSGREYGKRPFFSKVERDVLYLIGKSVGNSNVMENITPDDGSSNNVPNTSYHDTENITPDDGSSNNVPYTSYHDTENITPDDVSSNNVPYTSSVEIKVEIPETESPSNSNDLSPINVIWEQNSILPNFEPEISYDEFNNSTEKLLKEQLDIHKEFYKKQLNKMNEIDKCLKRTCMAIEKTNNLKKQQIEEIKRHNQIMENISREKNEIKFKKLEIKKHKLEVKRLKFSNRK